MEKPAINMDRLAQTFTELVRMDSVSRHEARVSQYIQERLGALGWQMQEDNAAGRVGGDCNNLVAKLAGSVDVEPIMFNAHMDTVEPGRGVEPVLENGVFRSKGNTILGADDKSAVAILLEIARLIHENNLAHGPLEVVFTVCEEIGLMGAKNLDFSLLDSTMGYSLDVYDPRGIVTRAPSANRLEFVVHGKEAHAGVAPERGVNAIVVAAKALANMPPGRVDNETTTNIGLISGGMATNIVPNRVQISGEARSHDEKKLAHVTRAMVGAFEDAVADQRQNAPAGSELADLEVRVESDFTHIRLEEDNPVVKLAKQASQNLGRDMVSKTSGGGADANVFNSQGILCGVLGTGMQDPHTVHETVELEKMKECAELVLEIIRVHAGQ